MKLNKGQGISLLIAIISFTVFSIASFLLPQEKTLVFWMAYLFGGYALIVMFVSIFKFFSKSTKEEQFLNMPVVVVSWLFFIAQMGYAYKEITTQFLKYEIALVVNLVIAIAYTFLVMIISAATTKIGENDEQLIQKIIFKDNLKNELLTIKSSDANLSKKIQRLIEDVTYSDPMSHSQLSDIENEIKGKVELLKKNIGDIQNAEALCEEITGLLKNRNNQCKSLKRVKEPRSDVNNGSGNKFVATGVFVSLGLVIAVLAVVFFVAPEMEYKKACEFMKNEEYDSAIAKFEELDGYKDSEAKIEEIHNIIKQAEYDEALKLVESGDYDAAISAFEKLGDFSDSAQKIDEINTLIKDKAYDEAAEMMNAEKYDEAITAFEDLDGYRDSSEKIDEIRDIVCEKNYAAAEEAYKKGDYETAIGLYYEVTPYKDSREKLVEIFNRQSSDKILYLGTYNGEPVAWRIIEMTGYEKMHLLADKTIRNLPVSDDITDTTFEESDIAKWLNNDFLNEFTDKDLRQIVETDGLKISLLSESEVQNLKSKGVDLSSDSDWWLKSESKQGFKYATPDAKVESAGDIHVRDKGVRPAIWINLE